MKLTNRMVLRVFASDPEQPRYGYDIGKACHLPSGILYPVLARLERAGWLVSSWDQLVTERGRQRRLYRLSDVGRTEVEAGRWASDGW